jgi:hypothetical protein
MDVQGASLSTISNVEVQGVSFSTATNMEVQGVSFSTATNMEVQYVSLSTATNMEVQGVSFSTATNLEVQYVSLSTASNMEVQGVSLSTISRMDVQCRENPFPHHKQCEIAGCIPVHRLQFGCAWCMYPFSVFLKCRNAGLFDMWSVQCQNEPKCLCPNQSGI